MRSPFPATWEGAGSPPDIAGSIHRPQAASNERGARLARGCGSASCPGLCQRVQPWHGQGRHDAPPERPERMTMSTEHQATIRKIVADENVKHIQLWFTDILGNLKMVEVPDRQLDSIMESGAAFDGSSISGYAEIEESDIVAMPDWNTFHVLPWAQGNERTAFVFCDVLDRNYQPFEGDPRWVLRRQLERAKAMGLDFYVGPELEYFYFKDAEYPELTDEGGYFDVLPDDLGNDLRKQTMRTLDK